MITLYGNTHSGHSYKVRLFLLLAQLPHQYQYVSLTTPRAARLPEFVRVSQFGEVPVLVDDEVALYQSNAILMYLAQKTRLFCGATDKEWLRITEWLSWEANRIGLSLPNLRYQRLWVEHPAAGVVAMYQARLLDDLAVLNQFLNGKSFLVGEQCSIADLSCAGYLYWLGQVDIEIADYPHIAQWLDCICQLPFWLHPDEAMRSE